MVLKVAKRVVGVTITIFFSNALLYKELSALIATAKAGSIGIKTIQNGILLHGIKVEISY